MTTQWFDLNGKDGLIGALEFTPVAGIPALELHLWRRAEEGTTTAVWLDENGVVLRVVRPGVA